MVRLQGLRMREPKLGLAAALAAVGLVTVGAGAARADYEGRFCPPSGGTITIGANSKCVHGTAHSTFWSNYIQNTTIYLAGSSNNVYKCVGAKQYSNGSGSNTQDFECGGGSGSDGQVFNYRDGSGYATLLNSTSSAHSGYYGFLTVGQYGP